MGRFTLVMMKNYAPVLNAHVWFSDEDKKTHREDVVSPINVIKTINVIPTINVIKFNHKCNTNHKCNNF